MKNSKKPSAFQLNFLPTMVPTLSGSCVSFSKDYNLLFLRFSTSMK
jgi:hypothetical protein